MIQVLSEVHWHSALIWLLSLSSMALVLIRPKGLPEAWWAMLGACLLVLFRLITPISALKAVEKGIDVYLFLMGMMIMSELARREGVFDWVAGHAVRAAKGSPGRLFVLVYGVGILVTVFLSNDATAVVLTPAVLTAVRAAEAESLPYLLICAFVANAASFVLPISNPANLVVYGQGMPPLGPWLATFGLPSLVSIVTTFAVLRWLARKRLHRNVKTDVDWRPLSRSGQLTLYGIGFLAITLMTSSALNLDLGAPACVAGLLVAAAVSTRDHRAAKEIVKDISWSVVPLVAGLFVIVEAMNRAGALHAAVNALQEMKTWPPITATFSSAFGVALLSNIMNNLPSGLISGAAVKTAGVTGPLRHAVLIGVDLGPNLSVTGSLATILWLIAIRREGEEFGFWRFLRWGMLIMPPALALAVLTTLLGPNRIVESARMIGMSNDQPFLTDVTQLRAQARKSLDQGPVTPNYQGDVKQTIDILQAVLATEIVCVLRYTQNAIAATGISSEGVKKEFEEHAKEEQQHMMAVAERINQLGGTPNFNPEGLAMRSASQYTEGGNLIEMIKENLVAERIACDHYRELIRFFGDKDPTTRVMMEGILTNEEEHANDMHDLLVAHEGKPMLPKN